MKLGNFFFPGWFADCSQLWQFWRESTPSFVLLLLEVGFNRCPFQLLRSYKRYEENKSKTGQECRSMQQADYHRHRPTPWMQESVSMHKSPTLLRQSRMNQARSEEEEKERRDRKDRGQEADEKKFSPTKQNTSEELNKAYLPRHRLRLTKKGGSA